MGLVALSFVTASDDEFLSNEMSNCLFFSVHIHRNFIKVVISRKCFCVFSDASDATMTSHALPSFTAFSVENSPLATPPALAVNAGASTTLYLVSNFSISFVSVS